MSEHKTRMEPCSACPYRCDVASGVWAASEYEKLAAYDDTGTDYEEVEHEGEVHRFPVIREPIGYFACHATPENLCAGWVHASVKQGGNLGLRLAAAYGWWDGRTPDTTIPMFDTHTEAAEHGLRDIDSPDDEAIDTMDRLQRKHPRLQTKERAREDA